MHTSLATTGNQISFPCSHLVWSRGHLPVLHPLAFTRVCTGLSRQSESSQWLPGSPLENCVTVSGIVSAYSAHMCTVTLGDPATRRNSSCFRFLLPQNGCLWGSLGPTRGSWWSPCLGFALHAGWMKRPSNCLLFLHIEREARRCHLSCLGPFLPSSCPMSLTLRTPTTICTYSFEHQQPSTLAPPRDTDRGQVAAPKCKFPCN